MGFFGSLKGSLRPKREAPQPGAPPPEPETESPTRPDVRRTDTSRVVSVSGPSAPPNRQIDWRVLFVGGEPLWFRQIEQAVLGLQPNWLCRHAPRLTEAEAAIESGGFDGLVVDGRIPEVDSLLNKLEQKTGRMICLVRCDVTDRITVAQWNRSGITPVSVDADGAALVGNLRRLERLRSWMADPAIKKLLPLIRKLPAAPSLHARVTEQLQSPNASIQTVALLISQDPVMSAKILQVANSAFFSLAQEVTDTAEAVMVMGTERVRSLILLAGVFSQYGDAKCSGFSPEPIWSHSLQVAMFARSITFGELKDVRIAETAFTAGLLHDIGKLVLAGNVPEMYDTAHRVQISKGISQREAELITLGTTHAELGACLLATWGLPLPILEAIAWHHEPLKSGETGCSLLAAVHVANVFAQESGQGSGDEVRDSISVEFLLRSGLGDCRNRWREFCGITVKQETRTPDERLRQHREAKEN
jgi:putative nucleotidyltransferase with HDIG domain